VRRTVEMRADHWVLRRTPDLRANCDEGRTKVAQDRTRRTKWQMRRRRRTTRRAKRGRRNGALRRKRNVALRGNRAMLRERRRTDEAVGLRRRLTQMGADGRQRMRPTL